VLAIGFICTSLALTIVSAQKSSNSSVVDQLGIETAPEGDAPAVPSGEDLLPPAASDQPLTPPRAE
jgi:preprotein translocase subunit SecG